MHEDDRLRRRTDEAEHFLLVGESIAQDHPCGRKIPEYELIALLGDRRRRGDVDDQRNAFLLGDLGDCGGLARIEGTDQELRSIADQLFGAGARSIDVRFGVGVHDREVGTSRSRGRCRRRAGNPGRCRPASRSAAAARQPSVHRPGPAVRSVRRARRRLRPRRRAHDGG